MEEAFAIQIEIGDRNWEATIYGNFGTLLRSLGEYNKTQKYLKDVLAIQIEIGSRNVKVTSFGNLGTVFQSLGKYDKAQELLEKALAIKIEIGNRDGEATSYGKIGTLFRSLGKYDKAWEIGGRNGETTTYVNLGTVFISLGKYGKAQEYLEKALAINIETGERNGEATTYGNRTLFISFDWSSWCLCDLMAIITRPENTWRKPYPFTGELATKRQSFFRNLASLFVSLGKYPKADDFLERAIAIWREFGERGGQIGRFGSHEIISSCQLRRYSIVFPIAR